MDVVFVGSGGCMRELVWQMQEQNKLAGQWSIIGYVDCERPVNGEGLQVGQETIRYLGTDDYLLNAKTTFNVVIAVGNPGLRKRIAEKLQKNINLQFPDIVLVNAKVCSDVCMGKGCIISMDAGISTNVTMGNFVFMNTGSMVCHDGQLGNYVTLSPDVKLAGNVTVGEATEIGMGVKVIRGVSIGSNVVIGAGGVVIGDTDNECTLVGVPARKIRG